MRSRLLYLELKTGYQDNGPAWIGRAQLSKSRRTVYFNGLALQRNGGLGVAGNYIDAESDDEYWVSGVKKDGRDRHRCGSGRIMIDRRVVGEYLSLIGAETLDRSRFEVCDDIVDTDIEAHHERENQPL